MGQAVPSDRWASPWRLAPEVLYLNHGSFAACPTAVLRTEMEREPIEFLDRALTERLSRARAPLAGFLGADPGDLVFVVNATTAVNAVRRSLKLNPGDELLLTSQTYGACRKSAQFVAASAGARVVTVPLPFPVAAAEQLTEPVLCAVTPHTRLALLDHVTSPTALVMPIERLVRELGFPQAIAAGVRTVVVLYLLLNVGDRRVLGTAGIVGAPRVAAALAAALFGPVGNAVVSVVVFLSAGGVRQRNHRAHAAHFLPHGRGRRTARGLHARQCAHTGAGGGGACSSGWPCWCRRCCSTRSPHCSMT